MDYSYYKIAGIDIVLSSDLPIIEETFHPKFKQFEVPEIGEDSVHLHHHFKLMDVGKNDLGEKVYEKQPWIIYENDSHFTYVWTSSLENTENLKRAAVFSHDHTMGVLFNDDLNLEMYTAGNIESLTMFPTDQILLARLLGDREGCMLHSAGVIKNENGLLFVGHSDAGKSTISLMMKEDATILCDDRNIIRKEADCFKLYGTWSHGDVEDVSSDSADLKAIFFLNQAQENKIARIYDKKVIVKKLLACVIRPFVTAAWWNNTLDLIEEIVQDVPCYELGFDKSGNISELIESKLTT